MLVVEAVEIDVEVVFCCCLAVLAAVGREKDFCDDEEEEDFRAVEGEGIAFVNDEEEGAEGGFFFDKFDEA